MRNCLQRRRLRPSSTLWDIFPKKWRRPNPQKKLPETDAIFDHLKQINEEADQNEQTLRVSMDAKATVKVGPFARGGKNRLSTRAADHDFHPVATVTPVGIFVPSL